MTSQTQPRPPAVTRQRLTSWFHRRVANHVMRPLSRYIPGQAVLETTGAAHRAAAAHPVGGRVAGGSFWLVADHGLRSHYVRNIQASPRVRLRIGALCRWRPGEDHHSRVPDRCRKMLMPTVA